MDSIRIEKMQQFNMIWMQGQTDEGDTISVLHSRDPDFFTFLEEFNINLLYHPMLSMQFGEEAQELFDKCLSGELPIHLFVFEGAVPTKEGYGDYFKLGDVRTMVKNFASQSVITIALGTCAAYGGLPAAEPNESGSVGLQWTKYEIGGLLGKDYVSGMGLPVVNLPGCPVHPEWFIETLQSLVMGKTIALDKYNRPLDIYGEKVHRGCKQCEYHERALWSKDFSEIGCLAAHLGCKGRTTSADCNIRLWNGVSSCTRSGHPCYGCCDPGFPESMLPFSKETLDLPEDLRAEVRARKNIIHKK